ncbi:DNA transfer protein [Salmonella enterica]|nr:DNA transfer protein [Salmonella enterica]
MELNVAVNMGEPDNDFFQLRADDLRDETAYRHRIQSAARKLANNVELKVANMAAEMGSLVITSPDAIGTNTADAWNFVADAEELMFSRELNRDMGTSYFFNSQDYKKAGYDLTKRDIFGRIPEEAYRDGTIQRQVAGFDDVLRSPKLPVLTKSTATGITVSGAQSFKPVAWQLDNDGNKVNVDDVSKLAKTRAGREVIAQQAANVSDDVAKAAEIAGVDINALTPGMRSGSRGVAQAEGILASKPGVTQDAHAKAFSEIQTKFNSALDDLGAEVGSAAEKSGAIKQRVLSGIDSMKSSEKAAWDNVRSTMPEAKARMSNTNSTIQGDINAGMPLTPEMKQFAAAYNKAGKDGITFDAMKAWRGKLADAEQKYIRSGEANMARRMGELRDAATEDMRLMAQKGDFIDQWTSANELSKARFAAQKQAETALGKDLATDSLVTNGVRALQNSAKSGTGKFNQMIGSLPEAERAPAIASILQDAMSQGVRGGKSEAAGISHIASILTPQNVAAISKHSKEIGKLAEAYGELARAATKPLRYVEHTGRSIPALNSLEQGLHPVMDSALSGAFRVAGSIGGYSGGGVLGAIAGATAGGAADAVARGAVSKLSATRSGRYAIEKAVQEATKAVKVGASDGALAAAERRFMANKAAVKAIRDAVGSDEFNRLSRAGIVASLSGMNEYE